VTAALRTVLMAARAPDEPLIFGVDETFERRRGKRIAAKGLCRDAVRSSEDYYVNASGLRWVGLMLVVPSLEVGRTWALSVLVGAPPGAPTRSAAGATRY